MAYVHERANWPRLRWSSETIAARLAAVRHKQGKLLGRMESLGFDVRAEVSLKVLTSDVVKTSAIEGEVLDTKEVRSSIARKLGLSVAGLTEPGKTRSERDVEGIVEMMLDATGHFELPLSEERLFGWHAVLFPTGWSGMHRISVGMWRRDLEEKMRVVSGAIGHERVHFEAPQAARLAEEMKAFLAWLNGPTAEDPFIRAGIAHFWFVTIHPFEDGNGRIARAIADMALARADGIKDRFYSMSSQIEAERKDYYLELEAAQKGDVDITRWLMWFLGCLERSIDSAEEGLSHVFQKARSWQRINQISVNERQRAVINRMFDGFEGYLTTSKYAKLAKCSADTALRDIRELVEKGVLVVNAAKGRSTSYRLVEAEGATETN